MWVAVLQQICKGLHKFVKSAKLKRSARIMTKINVNRNAKKRHSNRTNQCNDYATSVTNKVGKPSSSAKYSANMHRTQLSRTDNNEIDVH